MWSISNLYICLHWCEYGRNVPPKYDLLLAQGAPNLSLNQFFEASGFPIKDARFLKYLKSIFWLFYLPYHSWVYQENSKFLKRAFFEEILYLLLIVLINFGAFYSHNGSYLFSSVATYCGCLYTSFFKGSNMKKI